MAGLDDCVSKIVQRHSDEIKQIIVEQLLKETVGLVLESIYRQINGGKIKLIGVLNEDEIFDECVKYLTKKKK